MGKVFRDEGTAAALYERGSNGAAFIERGCRIAVPSHLPILGICGYSGSGKTTLIERILPSLLRRGLAVVVVKHDAHAPAVDRKGKDSDRFFRAGADVFLASPAESFLRQHAGTHEMESLWAQLAGQYDLVLVEGFKTGPIATRIWLTRWGKDRPPREAGSFRMILERQMDRPKIILDFLDHWLPKIWKQGPLAAGILVGASSRTERKKHRIGFKGRTVLARVVRSVRSHVDQVVLLGTVRVPSSLSHWPVLPDVPGMAGPLAGLRTAMRWSPFYGWFFLDGDMAPLTGAVYSWFSSLRKPGVRAIFPRFNEYSPLQLFPSFLDWRARVWLERVDRLHELSACRGIITPRIPPTLQAGWMKLNPPGLRK